nr:MAG TPA: hypothetical protein [Caudoviricetes sp.]
MIELKEKVVTIPYTEDEKSEKYTVKQYLTPEQVELIGNNMLKCSNAVERNVVKNTMLIKLMTDIPEGIAKDYDMLVKSGIIDVVDYNIFNVSEIDEYVEDELSIRTNVNRFLEQLNKTLDKYAKKIPNNKQIEDMLADSKKLVEVFGKK